MESKSRLDANKVDFRNSPAQALQERARNGQEAMRDPKEKAALLSGRHFRVWRKEQENLGLNSCPGNALATL